MRIAVIAPVLRKISSKTAYGGIERIIKSLVIASTNAGHQVVLYAPFGSDLENNNLEIRLTTDEDVFGRPDLIKQAEINLFQRIVDEQSEFDVIHSHIEPIIAASESGNYFSKITKPTVITFHNQTHIKNNIDYYQSHPEIHNLKYIFISHDQSEPLNFLPNKTVIYNGINLDGLTYNAIPNNNQLSFLGRITPEKGIVEAIEIARLSNMKLLIAAAIDESQRDFYEIEVKPKIDNENIIFLGEVYDEGKNNLLKNSAAFLFPINWHEPFGLVLVEALATGTPVLANDIGSVKEIIEDGKTGYIIPITDGPEAYVEKIKKLKDIDRSYCRKVAEEKFDEKVMTANYLKYYESVA